MTPTPEAARGRRTRHPVVLADPANPAADALISIAERLGARPRGLAGRLLSDGNNLSG